MLSISNRCDDHVSKFINAKEFLEVGFGAVRHDFCVETFRHRVNRFDSSTLADIKICLYDGNGQRRIERRRADVEADAISDFIVTIPLQGCLRIAQAGSVFECKAGLFCVLSTAIPFVAHAGNSNIQSRYAALCVTIPGAMLRHVIPNVDAISSIPLALQPGFGSLMRMFCDWVLIESRFVLDTQKNNLAQLFVRAVADTIAASPGYVALTASSKGSRVDRIRCQAEMFILRNLSNSSLDCKMIASHCQISIRYLHVVFSENDSVTKFSREARLQRCRAGLRSTQLATLSIAAIAAQWGMTFPASFTRTYQKRFGLRPGYERAFRREELKCPEEIC